MTLDELNPWWEMARLRADHHRPDYGDDDGSPEAVEAMASEFVAHCRSEMPWKFAPDVELNAVEFDREAARLDDLRPRGDAA